MIREVFLMPRKASGEIKTSIVKVKQKNGDTYVCQRRYRYDPEKKNNVIVSSKLDSKIENGQTEQVPTRPKKPNGQGPLKMKENITAKKTHIGIMKIIDHIGKMSGADNAVYSATDEGTAQKIISIARYLLATEGSTLPGISTWQITHPVPYVYNISEDVYHDLFQQIGMNASIPYNFFYHNVESLPSNDVIAFDSTTISTYSNILASARYGYNKDGDGLKTVKLMVLYSTITHRPVAYAKCPGDIPDVKTIISALNQLKTLNLKTKEIVMDAGYYSSENIEELTRTKINFIMRVRETIEWVKTEIDNNWGAFTAISNFCEYDKSTSGITVEVTGPLYKRTKKYGEKSEAEEVNYGKKLYLHLVFNNEKYLQDRTDFYEKLNNLKKKIEGGTAIEQLSIPEQKMAEKYLLIEKRGKKTTVKFDDDACREVQRYHGFLALISSKKQDTFECLRKYRDRTYIESFFSALKERADGARPRVESEETLDGRMFVQFVELCYYEYLKNTIKETIGDLEKELDSEELSKGDKNSIKKLKTWMENTPVIDQLKWFEPVEEVDVKSPAYNARWTSEMTARDAMFLQRIGVTDAT